MRDLDISFGSRPWEDWLRTKQMGDRVSAAQLLTILEEEDEQEVEDALAELEMACMVLDISDLPGSFGTGDTAARLRREAELVKKGFRPDALEPNDPLRLYLEEIAATPAAGDERLLAEKAAAGEEAAMVMLTNLGLSRVVALAGEYTGRGVLLLDLIQEGSLGLWQAVRSYRGGDYAAHAEKWVRMNLSRAVFLQARSSGVGQKLRTALEDYRAVDERLLSELGRNPTVEEIAGEMHIPAEEAEVVRRALENARMMRQVREAEKEPEETEEDEQCVENTALFQMRQRISELLSSLESGDRELLNLRFGLEGGLPLSAEDTARKLGLTPEEVTEREAAALAKLRNK